MQSRSWITRLVATPFTSLVASVAVVSFVSVACCHLGGPSLVGCQDPLLLPVVVLSHEFDGLGTAFKNCFLARLTTTDENLTGNGSAHLINVPVSVVR